MNARGNVPAARRSWAFGGALAGVAVSLVYVAAIFATAGRLDWLQGWALFVVLIFGTVFSRLLVARRYPDLVAERASFHQQQGIKAWDKALMPLAAVVGPLATLVVGGLDQRWGWTDDFPPGLDLLALVVLGFCLMLGAWAMLTNRFFAATVRLQTDRGQTVISGGPYAFVRHPGYSAAALGVLVMPLALGSWWGLATAAFVVVVYVLRTALEDATLRAELPGYADYARRVRYRLLPGVW